MLIFGFSENFVLSEWICMLLFSLSSGV